MRWKISAGALLVLAFMVPAGSALAHNGSSRPSETSCQTIVYADVRNLATTALDPASNTDGRVLATQILAAATAESLTTLPGKLQARLDGTADDLRAFLKTKLQGVWSTDLRIAVNQTMPNAGPNVKAAAQAALDNGTVDAYLAYLNDGLYVARARDCG